MEVSVCIVRHPTGRSTTKTGSTPYKGTLRALRLGQKRCARCSPSRCLSWHAAHLAAPPFPSWLAGACRPGAPLSSASTSALVPCPRLRAPLAVAPPSHTHSAVQQTMPHELITHITTGVCSYSIMGSQVCKGQVLLTHSNPADVPRKESHDLCIGRGGTSTGPTLMVLTAVPNVGQRAPCRGRC